LNLLARPKPKPRKRAGIGSSHESLLSPSEGRPKPKPRRKHHRDNPGSQDEVSVSSTSSVDDIRKSTAAFDNPTFQGDADEETKIQRTRKYSSLANNSESDEGSIIATFANNETRKKSEVQVMPKRNKKLSQYRRSSDAEKPMSRGDRRGRDLEFSEQEQDDKSLSIPVSQSHES
jgi:hypothetical protein